MSPVRREEGQVIVIIALLLVALFAVAAVVVDGTRLYAARRSTQSGADNAALAAALSKCLGGDPNAAALSTALSNGFNNDGATNTVEVNNPPMSGSYSGDAEYIEVLITSIVDGSFSQVIMPGALEASARAVSHCVQGGGQLAGGAGLLVLDSDNSCAFNASGNGSITVNNGGIQINSNNATQAGCASGNAEVNADTISVVGGVRTTGNADWNPNPTTGAPFVPDPLSGVAAPPTPTKPGGSCTTYSISGNGSGTINPGLYCSISASSNASLIMNPGVYYIDGGSYSISGNANLTANGVMIYLEDGGFNISGNGIMVFTAPTSGDYEGILLNLRVGNFSNSGNGSLTASGMIYMGDGNFSLSGNGIVDVSAPTSGDYQGMMLFMAQTNVSTISITGNGNLSTTGTIYGALSAASLSGNGDSMSSQVIVNTVTASGNGALTLDYDSSQQYGGAGNPIVSLAE